MTVSAILANITICSEIVRIFFWSTSVTGFFIAVILGGKFSAKVWQYRLFFIKYFILIKRVWFSAIEVYAVLILLSYYRQLSQKAPSAKDVEDDVIEAMEGVL